MKAKDNREELVTTEPQRKALEAMSEDLVRKLNLMVAEQEARAREFANHQHSLSSLPEQQQPQVTTYSPKPYTVPQAVYTPPPPKPKPEYQPPPTVYHKGPQHPRQKQPTLIRRKEKQQEEGVGATAIIVILLILFSILSRTCS